MSSVKCQHEDCENTDTVECRIFSMVGEQPDTEFFYYCVDHCAGEGFCYLCGLFWAGVEAFDFAGERGGIAGLCPECADELRADSREYDDEDDDGTAWAKWEAEDAK